LAPPVEFRLGDVLRLRKPHPCGNNEGFTRDNDLFEVVRLGADIGLNCTQCGRRILLPRSTLERRIVEFVRQTSQHVLPADLDSPSVPESTDRPAPR